MEKAKDEKKAWVLENIKNKILIIQLKQFGDVLMTTPVLRHIKNKFPEFEIHYLTEALGAKAIRYNPHVDKIIEHKGSGMANAINLIRTLRENRYKYCIDFQSNTRTALLSLIVRADHKVGFDKGFRSLVYHSKQNKSSNYTAITNLKLVNFLDPDFNDYKIDLYEDEKSLELANKFIIKNEISKKTICFCVVSRRNYKVIPELDSKIIAEYLLERGYRLLFVYGPGEKDITTCFVQGITPKYHQQIIYGYDPVDFYTMKRIISKCFAYVGNDGGLKHVANCSGIPTFTIYRGIQGYWSEPNSRHMFYDYQETVMTNLENCLVKLQEFLKVNS